MNYPSDDFDLSHYMPEVRQAEEEARHRTSVPGSNGGVTTYSPIHPRQPNLGYALLALAIGFFAVLLASLVILTLGQAMHLLPPLQGITPSAMPGATVLSEALGYLLTLAVIVPLFQKMWRRPFHEVLHVGFGTAARHAGKLMLLGVGTAVLAQMVESHMTLPKEMPIDAFFRSHATVWMVAIFGTFIAPVVEELIFRGFLLRGVAIAFDWVRHPRTEQGREAWRTTDTISRPAWIFSGILTSILFAVMHAAQLGRAWNAVAVLTLVGGVLTAVRLRLNSLAASSLVHIAYNGFIFVVLFFATDGFRHLEKMHGR